MQPTVDLTLKINTALLKTAVSKKTNNPYTFFELTFIGGYVYRFYPSNEQIYIFKSLAKSKSIPVKTDDDGLDFLAE